MASQIEIGSKSQDVELGDLSNDRRTRFQVNKVNNENSGSSSVINVPPEDESTDEDDNIHTATERTRLNSESDAKYIKSFRQLTREALPRLENYRNIMSLQAANRPTLEELHNATLPNKILDLMIKKAEDETALETQSQAVSELETQSKNPEDQLETLVNVVNRVLGGAVVSVKFIKLCKMLEYLSFSMDEGTDEKELVDSYPADAKNALNLVEALVERFGRKGL
ncbi:hypothetical protein FQR65_LT09215 [Abscondita terminalis]|nr:hypothetical protein FQR65_LT09215 [Abscondita terminalis]